MTRTGGVGSIGVIAVHMDQSGFDDKMGRKYTARDKKIVEIKAKETAA